MTMPESAWWLFLFCVFAVGLIGLAAIVIAYGYWRSVRDWQEQAERNRLMLREEVVRRRTAEEQIAGLAQYFASSSKSTVSWAAEVVPQDEFETIVNSVGEPVATVSASRGKLSRQQAEDARDTKALGATWQQLGEALGVSATTVRRSVQALPPKELTSLAGTE